MPLRKASGNMYDFITHTWNPIKGRCSHDCSYCYMKAMYKRFNKEAWSLHFDVNELKTNLCCGNFIFIGSSTDMWAQAVPDNWIEAVLKATQFNAGNKYLFQSKNPARFLSFLNGLSTENHIFCTTLESSRNYPECMGSSPAIMERVNAMTELPKMGFSTMITIEPVMDFDSPYFVESIKRCNPIQVNIGADSGNNRLPEPPKEKVLKLIAELEKFTKVGLKKNLGRLLK
jgi:DNA repair photolyase